MALCFRAAGVFSGQGIGGAWFSLLRGFNCFFPAPRTSPETAREKKFRNSGNLPPEIPCKEGEAGSVPGCRTAGPLDEKTMQTPEASQTGPPTSRQASASSRPHLKSPTPALALLCAALAILPAGRSAAGETNSIRHGETKPGQISQAGELDFWIFSGVSNDLVSAAMVVTAGPGNRPRLDIFDPDGFHIARTYGATNTAFTNLRLEKSGDYAIVPQAEDLLETFGYSLSLLSLNSTNLIEPGDGEAALEFGVAIGGRINDAADRDAYMFWGESNRMVILTLTVTNGPGHYPHLDAFKPDGSYAASTYGGSNIVFFWFRVVESGFYSVVVRAEDLLEMFSYRLTIHQTGGGNLTDPGDGPEAILPGETRRARITVGDFDLFTFSAIARDHLIVCLNRLTGTDATADPWLTLVDPEGFVVGQTSGPEATLGNLSARKTGVHTVIVHEAGMTGEFDYELSLLQWPITPPSSGINQYLAALESDGQIFLRWSASATNLHLESTPSLSPAVWRPETNSAPELLSGYLYVNEGPATNTQKFYRLKSTNAAP